MKKKKTIQTNVLRGNFSCRHPKLWSYIKSNVKAFFITGAITFVVSASATTVKILHSRQVRYKNDKSVEQAINELYEKAVECGKIIEGCYGCTKLEYLESTGTQYIDTGYYNTSDTKVDLSFVYLQSNGDIYSNGMIYGSANHDYGIPSLSIGLNLNNDLYYRNSNNAESFLGVVIAPNTIYSVRVFQNQIIINNTTYQSNMTLLSGRSLYTSYVFGRHQPKGNNVEINDAYGPFIGRIYYCKLYDNDTLVRDYIPVLDNNNRPCLFDKVSKSCFYNQGTGEFLYG